MYIEEKKSLHSCLLSAIIDISHSRYDEAVFILVSQAELMEKRIYRIEKKNLKKRMKKADIQIDKRWVQITLFPFEFPLLDTEDEIPF